VHIHSRLSAAKYALLGVALLLMTVLSACAANGRSSTASGSPPSGNSSATPTSPTLPGLDPEISPIEWTLLQFSLDGTDYPAMDGPPITLRMETDGAKVSGSSGCNDYSGTYTAEGVALRIELTGSSLRACACLRTVMCGQSSGSVAIRRQRRTRPPRRRRPGPPPRPHPRHFNRVSPVAHGL
jgi:heat shock protein HslJ